MSAIKKYSFVLSSVLVFFFSARVAECAVPQPFTIGGTVTVDGSQLNQGSDSGYTFFVTKQDGNSFNPGASDTDGLDGSNLYAIDIPIYEESDQPGGANPGDAAVIHVYRNGEELIVTSPANGAMTVGNAGITQEINLTVESPYTAPTQYQLTASALGGNGSVSPRSGIYDEGTVVRLIATPNRGYRVASWSGTDNDRSISNMNTVTMNSNKTVTVAFSQMAPVIASFSATPQTISQGESTTLSWNISGATSADIDNGIGSVDASEGSISVSPDTTTIYTLTATNSGGSVRASISVTVEEVPPQPPIADAGPDQDVSEGTTVTLSGLNSADPDGAIVSFYWEQTAGGLVALSDPWAPEISFTSPDVGMDGESLSFKLTVIDNDDLESWDECIVNVVWVNEPPSADAGPDQSVFSGDEVILDASMSSDVDDGIATYLWEQKEGPSVSLSGDNTVQAVFVAPDVGDAGDALTFVLTVTDNGNLKAVDTCVINVESWVNSPPIADAGPDQEVYEHDMVTLDGSGSVDWDDGIRSYLWTQTAGTPVALSDTLVVKPTFYAPEVEIDGEVLTFELTVADQNGLKSTDSCDVRVNQDPSEPPLSVFWVDSLMVSLQRIGQKYKAQAFVRVSDENLDPVKRATVRVIWTFNGRNPHTTSSVTNKRGVAQLNSSHQRARSGDVFTVEVIGVVKEGYAYDPSSNSATTRSIIVPRRTNNRLWSKFSWLPFFRKMPPGR
jgi:hypothetical protein